MASIEDPLTQILAALTDLQQQNALLNQKVSLKPIAEADIPIFSSNCINSPLNQPSSI